MKHLIEAESPTSMTEALEYALASAAPHLEDGNDMLISLVEQKVLRGGVHQVAIEVTVLPPGSHARDREISQVTARQIASETHRALKRTETANAWKKRIADHFRNRRGREIHASTRIHLENLPEFSIMGEIEREFFAVTHVPKKPASEITPPPPAKKPQREPEPE